MSKNETKMTDSYKENLKPKCALAGNRTRAPRVAGEDSTTEPPMRNVPTPGIEPGPPG